MKVLAHRYATLFVLLLLTAGPMGCATAPSSEGPGETKGSTAGRTDAAGPGDLGKTIETYLARNFGEASYKPSWYDSVSGVSVQGDTVTVKTNLSPNDGTVSYICAAVSGFVYSADNRSLGLQKVQIAGKDGGLLLERQNATDDCLP